jgi:hypothetical protein
MWSALCLSHVSTAILSLADCFLPSAYWLIRSQIIVSRRFLPLICLVFAQESAALWPFDCNFPKAISFRPLTLRVPRSTHSFRYFHAIYLVAGFVWCPGIAFEPTVDSLRHFRWIHFQCNKWTQHHQQNSHGHFFILTHGRFIAFW